MYSLSKVKNLVIAIFLGNYLLYKLLVIFSIESVNNNFKTTLLSFSFSVKLRLKTRTRRKKENNYHMKSFIFRQTIIVYV